jgi:hypothetical protein
MLCVTAPCCAHSRRLPPWSSCQKTAVRLLARPGAHFPRQGASCRSAARLRRLTFPPLPRLRRRAPLLPPLLMLRWTPALEATPAAAAAAAPSRACCS